MSYLYVVHGAPYLVHTCRTVHEAIAFVKARRTRMMRDNIPGSVKLTVLSSQVRGYGPYRYHHTMKFQV